MTREEFDYVKQQIKTFLSPETVITYYLSDTRIKSGRYKCPFNSEEEHNNLRVNKKGWRCFSCGCYGDEISFVQKLFNLDTYEAVEKIGVDFGLDLDTSMLNKEKFERERLRRERQRQKDLLQQEYLKIAERTIFDIVVDKLDELRSRILNLEPTSTTNIDKYMESELPIKVITHYKEIHRLENILGILCGDDLGDEEYSYPAFTKKEKVDRKLKLIKKILNGEVEI